MASAKEFRENADDCLVWAKTVTSDHERAIFLDMARNWLEAASRAEGRKIPTSYELNAWSKSPPAIGATRDKASSIGPQFALRKGHFSDLVS
jgi:hypothetical protein